MDKWNNLIREYLTGTALAGRIVMIVMAITFILVYLTDLII